MIIYYDNDIYVSVPKKLIRTNTKPLNVSDAKIASCLNT